VSGLGLDHTEPFIKLVAQQTTIKPCFRCSRREKQNQGIKEVSSKQTLKQIGRPSESGFTSVSTGEFKTMSNTASRPRESGTRRDHKGRKLVGAPSANGRKSRERQLGGVCLDYLSERNRKRKQPESAKGKLASRSRNAGFRSRKKCWVFCISTLTMGSTQQKQAPQLGDSGRKTPNF